HFVPSIYWGATNSTIIAPFLWTLIGAAYSAFVKWRSQETDIMSAWASATGRSASTILGAALCGFIFSGILNFIGYFIGQTIVSSSGWTKVLGVIGIAYCIAGLHHVLCDLTRSPINQPAYVRQGRSSLLSMIVGGLAWLPTSIFNLRWGLG